VPPCPTFTFTLTIVSFN